MLFSHLIGNSECFRKIQDDRTKLLKSLLFQSLCLEKISEDFFSDPFSFVAHDKLFCYFRFKKTTGVDTGFVNDTLHHRSAFYY